MATSKENKSGNGSGLPESVKTGFKFDAVATNQPIPVRPVEQSASEPGALTLTQAEVAAFQPDNEAIIRQDGNPVKQQSGNAVKQVRDKDKKRDKSTLYLDQAQAEKLVEIILAFRRAFGDRINQNEIIRYLVDTCDVESVVQGLAPSLLASKEER